MSSRPIITAHKVITNGDMSVSITSPPTVITNVSMISYEISWSGNAPAGSIDVQVSNSFSPNVQGGPQGNPVIWTSVILSAVPLISGNSGNGFIQLADLPAHAIRIVYTPTSGTGLMTAIVAGKVA